MQGHVMSYHVLPCHVVLCASTHVVAGSVILWSMIRCFGYLFKLTWLVLGGDPAARSLRVEQFTAL